MHSFTFNGHSSDEFGIRIERFPDLNRSERKYKSASVAGRNGNIYQFENAWEEVTVSYQIFAGERTAGAAVTDFTDIVEWLNSADDYAVLTDTYDPTHYRLAVFVDELEIESQWHTFGKATVRFRCRPQRFIVQSPISVNDGGTITNTTNHIAKPIITLTGSGARSLMDLRNLSMKSSQHNVEFGTHQLSALTAFKANGKIIWAKREELTPQYYEIKYLGENDAGTLTSINNTNGSIIFTPSSDFGIGIVMPVSANTDYTISFSGSNVTKIEVVFGQASGYNDITSFVSKTVSGSSSLTFKTPLDCGCACFIFYGTTNSATTFSSIMLTGGKTAKTFKAYADPSTNTLVVNDVSLSFSISGFSTAEIDCEKENFSVEGVDSNSMATVLDQYGNLSEQYIQLLTGNNTISWTGSITAVSIDPRFWEL